MGLTSANDLLNLDKGNIDFLGKFSHRLIWVLIGERVDINLDPFQRKTNRVVGKEDLKKNVQHRMETH